MSRLPRFALGTIQPEADSRAILWSLLEALHRQGIHVQSFLSRACFPDHPGSAAITGLADRHLDSWLMSPDTCREIFLRGSAGAHLSMVAGSYYSGGPGGRLEPLCDWLDLPRLAVLDASRIGPCRLPPLAR